MTLILPYNCSNCPAGFKDGKDIFCRLNPPVPTPIITVNALGPTVVGNVNSFPKVEPDWYCMVHPKRRDAMASPGDS